jgi:cytoskeletal protein CcmA (bactofilin family)
MMGRGDKKNKVNYDSPDRLNRLVEGAIINGDITLDSSFRLDGKIIGNINCDGKFVLGDKGDVKGNIQCLEAEIEGSIEGDLRVNDLLVLRKTAVLTGTIQTSRIVIEDGAQIGGSIKTSDAPKSQAQPVPKNQEESDIVY